MSNDKASISISMLAQYLFHEDYPSNRVQCELQYYILYLGILKILFVIHFVNFKHIQVHSNF